MGKGIFSLAETNKETKRLKNTFASSNKLLIGAFKMLPHWLGKKYSRKKGGYSSTWSSQQLNQWRHYRLRTAVRTHGPSTHNDEVICLLFELP